MRLGFEGFGEDPEDEDALNGGAEDDLEEELETEMEEPVLMLKCRMMLQGKPCCYQGECVRLRPDSLEMMVCKHFIIFDASEEDLTELRSQEEN